MDSQNAAMLRALTALVKTEGPIHFDLAARRVAERWGKTKLTKHVERRIQALIERDKGRKLQFAAGFLWPAGSDPSTYRDFRSPDESSPESERHVSAIAPEELANAAFAVLERNVQLPDDDLLRETAKVFRITRLGRLVRESLARGVTTLEEQGRCVRENGDVRLASPPEAVPTT